MKSSRNLLSLWKFTFSPKIKYSLSKKFFSDDWNFYIFFSFLSFRCYLGFCVCVCVQIEGYIASFYYSRFFPCFFSILWEMYTQKIIIIKHAFQFNEIVWMWWINHNDKILFLHTQNAVFKTVHMKISHKTNG